MSGRLGWFNRPIALSSAGIAGSIARSAQTTQSNIGMIARTTFLHVTDAHFSASGTSFRRGDRKIEPRGLPAETRETAFEHSFARLADRLEREGRRLDGLIFSGDAQVGGTAGGHRLLFDMFIRHFGRVGIEAGNIVAVPGNHDVDRRYDPSTYDRYRAFIEVWREEGCVVPWLDGVDKPNAPPQRHRLTDANGGWTILPINSSNWCESAAVLPSPLKEIWDTIPELAAGGDMAKAAQLRDQLGALARYDMARLSDAQLDELRRIVDQAPLPENGRQLRIAVMHHHLRAPGASEELKPFPDISNLEQVRGFLRERRIDVLIHGHKHEAAVRYEHFDDDHGEPDRRLLVVSGSTIEEGRESDAMRLITLTGLPYVPKIEIEAIGLTRGGLEIPPATPLSRRLWRGAPRVEGGPTVVNGSDIDEVYARATEAASLEAANGTLVVNLDLPDDPNAPLPLPRNYPMGELLEGGARERWLLELVEWWQRDRSQLEHRMPFVHGGRLRRYGGKIDQIARIKKLLAEKTSTRALAVLVDPFRDFTEDGKKEQFASFSLVEFKRRELAPGRFAVDAVAFYRAQEFARWWPINVAELRYLQNDICGALRFVPGRITTIAGDARTHSRTPTQVAMPIVDRWLDQAPQRLHALANALVRGAASTHVERESVRGWDRCIEELRAATEDFNPDGVPVPIEGLEAIAAFLTVVEDATLDELARVLRRLASDNRTFESGPPDRATFNTWALRTVDTVDELRRLTAARLGTGP